MKPKILAVAPIVAVATALSLGLAGCGSDSNTSDKGSGSVKLIALDKAEAQDSDSITVTKETAEKFDLTTIADLAKKGDGGSIASQMTFGGPPEFKTRVDGIPGLQKNYGVQFGKYTVTDAGGPVTVNALKRGQVQAVDLFTTDPAIVANDFVVLEDPKSNFAAQNIVPIIAESKATDGVKETLNGVQAKLTSDQLGDLIGQVANDKKDPKDVAGGWLEDNGLSATGTSAKGASLTIGSANFPESVILAEIYAGALRDQGATIKTKLNIGSREKYFPALKAGSLDLFPEYTGTVLQYIDKKATATSPDDVYAALGKALASQG